MKTSASETAAALTCTLDWTGLDVGCLFVHLGFFFLLASGKMEILGGFGEEKCHSFGGRGGGSARSNWFVF